MAIYRANIRDKLMLIRYFIYQCKTTVINKSSRSVRRSFLDLKNSRPPPNGKKTTPSLASCTKWKLERESLLRELIQLTTTLKKLFNSLIRKLPLLKSTLCCFKLKSFIKSRTSSESTTWSTKEYGLSLTEISLMSQLSTEKMREKCTSVPRLLISLTLLRME